MWFYRNSHRAIVCRGLYTVHLAPLGRILGPGGPQGRLAILVSVKRQLKKRGLQQLSLTEEGLWPDVSLAFCASALVQTSGPTAPTAAR